MKTVLSRFLAALAIVGVCYAATPVRAQSAGAFVASTPALATSLAAVGGTHRLQSLEVSADSTLSAAAWWILIYDATADPGNGAQVPKKCYALPSGTTSANYAFATGGANMVNGIVVVVSTTGCFTETQSTHAFISVDWQ